MEDGLADPAVIHHDVCTAKAEELGDDVAGILAGFPCQARNCLTECHAKKSTSADS